MELRGRFSVEWLSQSSQVSPKPSGTACESLPGFYGQTLSHTHSHGHTTELSHTHSHGDTPELSHTHSHGDTPELSHTHSHGDTPELSHTHSHEADFSGTEEEETSGYESEGSRSVSPTAPASATAPPAGRRPRTAFTAQQISSLERAFKRSAYLGAQDKSELCTRLSLSDKQIRNWFQNRRMKLKRTVQDRLAQACQAKAASQLMCFSDLQGLRAAPYPSFFPAHQDYGSGFSYGPTDALLPYGLSYPQSYPPYTHFYSSQ